MKSNQSSHAQLQDVPHLGMDHILQSKNITGKSSHKPRHLNEYTTIPRKPRAHPQNPQDYVQTIISRHHATVVDPKCEDNSPDSSSDVKDSDSNQSGSQASVKEVAERRERSWSFKKFIKGLGRSKSLKQEKSESSPRKEEEEDDTDDVKTAPQSCTAGLLFSSKTPTTKRRSSQPNTSPAKSLTDTTTTTPEKTKSSTVSLPVSGSIRDMNVAAGNTHLDTGDPGPRLNKGGMLKVFASWTLRTHTQRRKGAKRSKPADNESVATSTVLSRDDPLRGSLKEPQHKDPKHSECRRSTSFTTPAMKQSQSVVNPHYKRQLPTESVYSLAQSDVPPPLPERTYLKYKNNPPVTSKENSKPLEGLHTYEPVYDSRGRNVLQSRRVLELNNNNKPTSLSQVSPLQFHSQKPLHKHGIEPTGAKPFLLHLQSTNDVTSSDYGSVSSDSFSLEPDYFRTTGVAQQGTNYSMSCNLPRRSKAVTKSSSGPPLPVRSKTAHEKSETPSSAATPIQTPSVYRRHNTGYSTPEERLSDPEASVKDCTLSRSKVHNLPLRPDDPKRATLIKTLRLHHIMKDRWISGLAVTKKNEYIVLDQREAYLLDDDGNLKKIIGNKNSNKLIEPLNVAVCPNSNNLVICDHAEQDVKIYSAKGQFLKRVKDPSLTNIAGVAVTANGDIVIAGTDKQRLSVISEDNLLLHSIPQRRKDDAAGSRARALFQHPYSVAVNPLTGDIIVGDDSKQMVTAVSVSSDGLTTKVMWRYDPTSGERHFFPSAICADQNGYIFIADLYNEKVYMLDSGGRFVRTVLSRGDGLKGGPGALAVDARGHLLVADEEKTVKVFKYGDENGFAVDRRYSYCPQAR